MTLSKVPWLVAVIGLTWPLAAGGGAGWIYVVGWLVVLAGVASIRPLRDADHWDRVGVGALACGLLIVPGFVIGGIYLLPAVLAWLLIEIAKGRSAEPSAD